MGKERSGLNYLSYTIQSPDTLSTMVWTDKRTPDTLKKRAILGAIVITSRTEVKGSDTI